MGYAVVFTGQGAQHPQMLPWLGPDRHLAAVAQALGEDWRSRLADPQWAGHNPHAQVLLTGLAMAAFEQLVAELGPPAIVAGYSVGELAAFCAAGVLPADAVVDLARQRAACMDRAGDLLPTGLMGVSGRRPGDLAALCQRFGLDLAIALGGETGVLGGPLADLREAEAQASGAGMQVTRLNVALASHTRWMRPAADAFRAVLAGVALSAPALPLLSNALGRVRNAGGAREALVLQLFNTVRWDRCQEQIQAERVQAVLEIGPGQALARRWGEACADIPARSADEFRSLGAVVAWVRRCLDMA